MSNEIFHHIIFTKHITVPWMLNLIPHYADECTFAKTLKHEHRCVNPSNYEHYPTSSHKLAIGTPTKCKGSKMLKLMSNSDLPSVKSVTLARRRRNDNADLQHLHTLQITINFLQDLSKLWKVYIDRTKSSLWLKSQGYSVQKLVLEYLTRQDSC